MENGRGGGSPAFLTMRVDINLATRPYEDSSSMWLRWGGALAALSLFTLVLAVHGDSRLGGGTERPQPDRAARRADRSPRSGKDQGGRRFSTCRKTAVRATVPSSLTNSSGARRSPGPRSSKIWSESCPPGCTWFRFSRRRLPTINWSSNWWWRENRGIEHLNWCARWKVRSAFSRLKFSRSQARAGRLRGDNVQFDITAVYIPDLTGSGSTGARSTP